MALEKHEENVIKHLRGTPEYAAAFSVEVWKAEEKRKFLAQLEEEKKRVVQKLQLEFEGKDRVRVKELDEVREELQRMAKRLESGGTALQKRVLALESREAAFDRRRMEITERHEEEISASETRYRHLIQDIKTKNDVLASKHREKDLVIQQLKGRIQLLEREYDMLQTLVSRYKKEESVEKAHEVTAERKISELTRYVKEQREFYDRLQYELNDTKSVKDELVRACNFYKKQVNELVGKYNELAGSMSRIQQERLAEQQQKLEKDKQEMKLKKATSGYGLGEHETVHAADVLGAAFSSEFLRGVAARGGEVENNSIGCVANFTAPVDSDISQLRSILNELSEEAKKEEDVEKEKLQRQLEREKIKRKKLEDKVARQEVISMRRQQYRGGIDPREQAPAARRQVFAERTSDRRAIRPLFADSSNDPGMNTTQDVTVSTPSCSSKDASTMSSNNTDEQAAENYMEREATAENPSGNDHMYHDQSVNLSSDSIQRVEVPSFPDHFDHSKPPQIVMGGEATRNCDDNDYDTYLVPSNLVMDEASTVGDTHPHEGQKAVDGDSTTAGSVIGPEKGVVEDVETKDEIQEFITRLKSNRQNLIDTGVYTPTDPLILEMDEKVASYTRMLGRT